MRTSSSLGDPRHVGSARAAGPRASGRPLESQSFRSDRAGGNARVAQDYNFRLSYIAKRVGADASEAAASRRETDMGLHRNGGVALHAAVPGRDVTHSEMGTRPTRSATPRRTERDPESAGRPAERRAPTDTPMSASEASLSCRANRRAAGARPRLRAGATGRG